MFDAKIAIVVRDDLLDWQKLNVAAFLSCGVLGAKSLKATPISAPPVPADFRF